MLASINDQIEDFQSHELRFQEQILSNGIDKVTEEFDDIISKCPPHLLVTYDGLLSEEDYQNFNWWQRLKHKTLK